MTRPGRFSTPRARIGLAGLAGVGVLAVLGLAEVAVRLLDVGPTFQVVHFDVFQPSSNAKLQYDLRPGARDGAHTISSAGLRDREFTPTKPEGVFRIVAVGDSVTFGLPGTREESWPKQLERLLGTGATAAAPRFEVLNLGVTGYNITQAAERLRATGMDYDPDLVLYGYVLNDPQSFSFEGQVLRRAQDARQRVGRGLARALSWSRLFLLVRHSTMGRGEAPSFREEDVQIDPGYVAVQSGDARGDYFRALHHEGDFARRLEEGLDAMQAAAGDVPVILAIFPLFLDLPGATYGLTDVHDRVAAAARERRFHVVDLQPAFAAVCVTLEARRCVGDFMHPSTLGYRVAAAALLAEIERSRLLPEGSVSAEPRPADGLLDVHIASTLASAR